MMLAMDTTINDTRLRILREAAALFRRHGYRATSMADLAAAVGITKSSLYHHFPSKDALLLEICQITVDRVMPMIEEILASDLPATDKLERAITTHLVEGLRDRDNLACFVQEGRNLEPTGLEAYLAKRDRYERLFRDILTEGMSTGVFRTIDVRLTAMALLGMCNSSVAWYRPGGGYPPEVIAKHFADLAVRSVLAEGQVR